MSNRIGQDRNKDRPDRRQVGLKVRWRELFIYGPLVVLLWAFALGPFLLDLYEHPDLWNAIVLLAVVFVTVIIWPKLWPKKNKLWPKRRSRKPSRSV